MKQNQKKPQMIKDFGLLLKAKPESYGDDDQDIKTEDLKGYMDPANVCMIIPLKKWVKEAIISLYVVGEPQNIPNLDYKHQPEGLNNTSEYSMEYLRMALKLADYYEAVELSLKNEYPLRIKTDDFIIILAPRVNNE